MQIFRGSYKIFGNYISVKVGPVGIVAKTLRSQANSSKLKEAILIMKSIQAGVENPLQEHLLLKTYARPNAITQL